MRSSIRRFFELRPFTMGFAAAVAIVAAGATLVSAKPLIQTIINGTVAYVADTHGAVVYGDNDSSGIGIEGVTGLSADSGAIAVKGFATNATHASIGVWGTVNAPASLALIGSANAMSGAPSAGIEGYAWNGEGIFSSTESTNFAAFRSLDANGLYDVRLSDAPNNNAVTATLYASSGGAAVLGQDAAAGRTNIGVLGTTANGLYGVEGTATGLGAAGVRGLGLTDAQVGVVGESESGGAPGVYGTSSSSIGVLGHAIGGNAVEGTSVSGDGVEGTSLTGDAGLFSSISSTGVFATTLGTSTAAVIGFTSGSRDTIGVVGAGSNAGLSAQCAVDGKGGTGMFMITGFDSALNPHYTVDCQGNVSTFLNTRHGMTAQAYAPRNALPTLEDEGEAQLVDGAAAVRLDSAFADAITDRSPYLVFITPQGDCRGLYVSHKTLTGFEVHESMGGRSTLAFDYRIVAKPNGIDLAHMPLYSSPHNVLGGHLIAARFVQPAIARKVPAQWNAATRVEARTIHQTNMYEPRIGSDGKLHSAPIKYTSVVIPY
jgi:hypothetical protein